MEYDEAQEELVVLTRGDLDKLRRAYRDYGFATGFAVTTLITILIAFSTLYIISHLEQFQK